MIRGLTLPNRQWELYTKDEEDAILDLHPTGVLVLAYPGSTVQGWKTIQDAALWRELGKPEFLLRPYADNIVNWEPEEWIEECLRMVLGYEQEGVKVGGLIPANEMNIEGWGEDVGRIASWLRRASIQAAMRRPDIPLHFPALSPTGRYWDILSGLYTSESRADGFSVVDAHIYSYDQLWDIPRLNTLFQKPICITEYNRMMPSAVMYSQLLKIGKVTGTYFFILNWNLPEPGAPDVSLMSENNRHYYEDFKSMQGGQSMTKEELWEMIAQPYTQYPALSKRIAADGGIPIGREVEVEGYTFQLGMLPALETDSTEPDLCVSYARTGDWGNVELAEVPDDLPDLDSH